MNKSILILSSLLVSITSYVNGQGDQFKYQRPLSQVSDEYHSLAIPDDIFSKINKDLSDLRIIGITTANDTIEAPYLIEVQESSQIVQKSTSQVINRSFKGDRYYYTILNPTGHIINNISLEIEHDNFDGNVDIEGSQDNSTWYSIIEDYRILAIKNQRTEYRHTDLHFENSNYKYFRICIKSPIKPKLTNAIVSQIKTSPGQYKSYNISSFVTKEDQDNRQTIIDIILDMPLPISRINVAVNEKFDFYRHMHVSYVTDSINTDMGWKYNYKSLASKTISSIDDNSIQFNSTILRKLRVVINNYDDQPLQVTNMILEGPVHRIIFRNQLSADYYLKYGSEHSSEPQYDIVRFKNNIPSKLTDVVVGIEQIVHPNIPPKPQSLFENRKWLYGVMALIIVLLGWATISIIRKPPAPSPSKQDSL